MNLVLPTYYIWWNLFIGLRTEFRWKATYAVEALKPPVIMSHRFHRFTQMEYLCKSVKSVGPIKFQLHEFCVKFIKKMHGNVGDYKYFVTFALDYENLN